jgi:hypothetical protein
MLLFTFRVAIHPESSSEDDTDVKAMWKAKISQIRRQGRSYFVKIAWFYSPSDMLAQLKGNKDMCGFFFFRFISHQPSFFFPSLKSHFHPRELILSDHEQILPASTIFGGSQFAN